MCVCVSIQTCVCMSVSITICEMNIKWEKKRREKRCVCVCVCVSVCMCMCACPWAHVPHDQTFTKFMPWQELCKQPFSLTHTHMHRHTNTHACTYVHAHPTHTHTRTHTHTHTQFLSSIIMQAANLGTDLQSAQEHLQHVQTEGGSDPQGRSRRDQKSCQNEKPCRAGTEQLPCTLGPVHKVFEVRQPCGRGTAAGTERLQVWIPLQRLDGPI